MPHKNIHPFELRTFGEAASEQVLAVPRSTTPNDNRLMMMLSGGQRLEAQQVLVSQLQLRPDTKETRATVVKEQQSGSIVANDFVETCGGYGGGGK